MLGWGLILLVLLAITWSSATGLLLPIILVAVVASAVFQANDGGLVYLLLLSSIPISGGLAALFVSQILPNSSRILGTLGVVLSLCLACESRQFDQLPDLFVRVSELNIIELTPIILLVASKVVFVAATIAVVLLMLNLTIEFPIAWCFSSFNSQINLSGIRVVFLLGFVSLAFNLIVGLVSSQVTPLLIADQFSNLYGQ